MPIEPMPTIDIVKKLAGRGYMIEPGALQLLKGRADLVDRLLDQHGSLGIHGDGQTTCSVFWLGTMPATEACTGEASAADTAVSSPLPAGPETTVPGPGQGCQR